MNPLRVLAYSHDSFGLGHLRRSLSVATALVRRSRRVSVVLLTGSPIPDLFELPERCEIVKLPCLTKDPGGSYVPRSLPLSLKELLHLRTAIISATVRSFRPDLLLVDHTPTGPGGELLPVLRKLRHEDGRIRVVLGLRDIIDAPERARAQLRREGALSLLQGTYDEILVYSDPRIFDIGKAYCLPEEAREKTRYVGFACPPTVFRHESREVPRPRILASAGGGEDGYGLLRGVNAALRGPLREEPLSVTLVAGPFMPAEEVRALEASRQGDQRITVLPTTRDMTSLIVDADLVIGMGGYNTVYETLKYEKRLLVLPRSFPREEQLQRSRRLEELELLSVLTKKEETDPQSMGMAITRALASPQDPGNGLQLSFRGAEVVAEHLLSGGSSRVPNADPGVETEAGNLGRT